VLSLELADLADQLRDPGFRTGSGTSRLLCVHETTELEQKCISVLFRLHLRKLGLPSLGPFLGLLGQNRRLRFYLVHKTHGPASDEIVAAVGLTCAVRTRRYRLETGATTPGPSIGHDIEVDRCNECQFDYDSVGPGAVSSTLRSLGGRFGMRISNERGDPTLALTMRTRPGPRTWSALEYACHLRDVFLIQRERLYLTLIEDCPSFARMYGDDRATLARYGAEDPKDVGRELTVAAEMLAWGFEGLDETQWQRRCIYNFPEAAERSVLWLGRHSVHEGEHHLHDVDAVLRSAAATVRTGSALQDPRSHSMP